MRGQPRHKALRVRTRFGVTALVALLAATLSTASGVPALTAVGEPAPGGLPVTWDASTGLPRPDTGPMPLGTDDAVTVSGPKGQRTWTASALAQHDLPAAAEHAYRRAAQTMATTDPGCGLGWTLLAGIGRVESDHGRYGGSVLGTDGVSRPRIIGVALNGVGPVAAVHDTDRGTLDGDTVWDRAVGPMQFIPSTWRHAARDGDGDGARDPGDLDDAALAAAAYLCSGSGPLTSSSAMRAAVLRYNPSQEYADLVLAFEVGYRTGVFIMPTPEPSPASSGASTGATAASPRRHHHSKHHQHGHPRRHAPSATPSPAARADSGTRTHTRDAAPTRSSSTSPSQRNRPGRDGPKRTSGSGSPTPTSTPTPTPSPAPRFDTLKGVLSTCASGWCVDRQSVDLGPPDQLAARAAHDYDRDGNATETNAQELAGLTVTLQVARVDGATVYTINGLGYRFADGSFAT